MSVEERQQLPAVTLFSNDRYEIEQEMIRQRDATERIIEELLRRIRILEA